MRAHRSCQRKNVSLALSRMRRNRFPPNQSGAGEPKRNRNRQLAVPVGVSRIARNVPSRNSAGEQRVLPPFSRRKRVVAAAACTKGSWFWPRGQTTPKICENMSADNRQHPLCPIPGSHVLLSANKRTQKLLPPLCSRGKRNDLPIISTPRFKLSDFPRLAGRWLSRPIAVRYL